jgi:hypothetical protein
MSGPRRLLATLTSASSRVRLHIIFTSFHAHAAGGDKRCSSRHCGVSVCTRKDVACMDAGGPGGQEPEDVSGTAQAEITGAEEKVLAATR